MDIFEAAHGATIQRVRVACVSVVNPRSRSAKVFAGIVESIATVGLKRPITVSRTEATASEGTYDLICGQGRLEAFKALGEELIPAIVVDVSEADRYLMSLVENLARRKHTTADLLGGIRALEERGYSSIQIAAKTGLDSSYVNGILHLLKEGEERLIGAVEKGWLPISLAMDISKLPDAETQVAMMHAYQDGVLKGDQLMKVRRLIDRRRALGRDYGIWNKRTAAPVTATKLRQTYQNEVRRQRLAIKKAEISEGRLLFVVGAMRRLLSDEHFRTVLRAEGVEDMPTTLAERIRGEERP